MGNFFGNIDDQSVESMRIIGHSWLFDLFIFGACLLLASVLVNWQLRRIERMLARGKPEDTRSSATDREIPPQNPPHG